MVMKFDEFGRVPIERPAPGTDIKIVKSKIFTETTWEHYTVVKHYKDYILCRNKHGMLESITNGELVQNGLCKNIYKVETPSSEHVPGKRNPKYASK